MQLGLCSIALYSNRCADQFLWRVICKHRILIHFTATNHPGGSPAFPSPQPGDFDFDSKQLDFGVEQETGKYRNVGLGIRRRHAGCHLGFNLRRTSGMLPRKMILISFPEQDPSLASRWPPTTSERGHPTSDCLASWRSVRWKEAEAQASACAYAWLRASWPEAAAKTVWPDRRREKRPRIKRSSIKLHISPHSTCRTGVCDLTFTLQKLQDRLCGASAFRPAPLTMHRQHRHRSECRLTR
ncbi:hypothetical protein P170DRAFT_48823 [Aspergillus steynii IBT 23096]|uniref:Uncharacterized protein n=1 Tax=Aspergillus steynii IBT 23096 TaxID=1392250 RepID=A0A2I2GS68_9EURO|nr:uncharacterized protein P170DRAFT_48823 [Aspergillus steynii IBT 23096]PLB55724.1 hypothetical protein P170DRAFT_48823 [Aspergillus steynii IBT 23096]